MQSREREFSTESITVSGDPIGATTTG